MLPKRVSRSFLVVFFNILFVSLLLASDWPSWRGPHQNGVSDETGLISNWSLDGENLVWKVDFTGRSTPIIMNGRVYVVGRTGEGKTMQRVVACYAAKDGKLIWQNKENVFHTTIPFTRVGWASLGGDIETGNVYFLGVGGLLTCYDGKTGEVLWQHTLAEEFHRFSGYGGRTVTPLVDEDLVHISYWTWSAWGEKGPPKPRFAAYDKYTGELVWESYLASPPKNTNYSNPVITVINGIRTLITGGPDGAVHAVKARTGEPIWHFKLSKGAIQASVVVDGDKVYAAHGAENFDSIERGRVVCIDANGKGDITKTNEVWRYDGLGVGYASPAIHAGKLYVVTDQGDLVTLNASDGNELWRFNLGTVGKGSPIWADGKIFATEVNGGFHIIEPGENGAKSLDRKKIAFNEKRTAEVYGSPAIAYNRVYFTTEQGLFCLGDKESNFKVTKTPAMAMKEELATGGEVAHIQIVPASIWLHSADKVKFKIRTFDAMGRKLKPEKAQFTLNGLTGKLKSNGEFLPDNKAGIQAGYVIAKVGELESKARVQVTPELPIIIDFEDFAVDKNPPYWPNASKFIVKSIDGNNVLLKPPSRKGLNRHNLYLAIPDLTNYTIQADVKGTKVKRRSPDMGLIANRYYFDFMTKKKRLQIRTWPAELERFSAEMPYEWNPDLWYTMKMQVEYENGKATIKGKIWPREEKEPEGWTLTAVDEMPNKQGSPALYGDSAASIYFDNVKITRSK